MDLSLIFDLVLQKFKEMPGSTILSVISIFIAVSVFRFNKKMGYSKLSVLPIVYQPHEVFESSLDFTYHLSRLSYPLEAKGLPTNRLEYLVNLDILEKKLLDKDYDDEYTSTPKPGTKLLVVKLKNKGELASTNIKVSFVFKAYGSKVKYEKNTLIFKSSKRKVFSKRKIIIKVPYIGANDEKQFVIVDLKDQFRETELILSKIKANGHIYFSEKLLSKIFNNRVVINHQIHPQLKNSFYELDKNPLFSLDSENEKWLDPYSNRFDVLAWIGGKGWQLRSWFVAWRK